MVSNHFAPLCMEERPINGILENFRIEFLAFWERLPNKAFFFVLLVAWLGLFQFFGNSTLGYVRSSSLMSWMLNAIHPSGDYFNSDEAHIIVVPFLVLGLFWWKRKKLMEVPFKTWSPALGIVAFALLLHLCACMIQQPKLSVISLFVGIYGLTGLAWGFRWLQVSFFPFFLFAFCLPLGDQAQPITFNLRLLVCWLVEKTSYVLAVDILRDGTKLLDPTGTYQYEVAVACSGMRSQMATLILAIAYAFVTFDTWWKRGLLIASAFPLAVLGNFLRMMAIILASEFGGQEWGNYIHDGGPGGIFSLLPYVPAFAGLIILGNWLRDSKPRSDSPNLEPVLPDEPAAIKAS